jgi:hypothetical protein
MSRFDENSGLVWGLIGLIVLVMAGVFLSIIVDTRFRFSRGQAELETSQAESEAFLAELRVTARARQDLLLRATHAAGDSAAMLEEITPQLAGGDAEIDTLTEKRAALAQSITTLEKSFAEYRAAYRNAEWRLAIGEKHPSLAVRGGRTYQDVEITRVTPVGLEIRHADGIARIEGPDLPVPFQERFQWQDEERRAALHAEDENHRLTTETPKPPTRRAPSADPGTAPTAPAAPAVSEELTKARSLVIRWETRVDTLANEYSTARSMAGNGRSPSVPGSLETWHARAQRLSVQLEKARNELSNAKVRLAGLSPDDPLLRPALER